MKTENTFIEPDFSNAKLEFRFENNVICIYGTQEGLQWLIKKCGNLIAFSGQGHVHIDPKHDTLRVLTKQSSDASIAIFLQWENTKKKNKETFVKTNRQFIEPNFSNAGLEFRFEDNVVRIFGTPEGLRWFVAQCEELIENSWQGHIHIDPAHDMYRLLTKQSLDASIAIFPKAEKPEADKRQCFWRKLFTFSKK